MSKIKILIPIYNDWRSSFKLLEDIDLQVNDLNHEFSDYNCKRLLYRKKDPC